MGNVINFNDVRTRRNQIRKEKLIEELFMDRRFCEEMNKLIDREKELRRDLYVCRAVQVVGYTA